MNCYPMLVYPVVSRPISQPVVGSRENTKLTRDSVKPLKFFEQQSFFFQRSKTKENAFISVNNSVEKQFRTVVTADAFDQPVWRCSMTES